MTRFQNNQGWRSNTIQLFLTLFAFIALYSSAWGQNPWVQNFTPVRQLYISPTGNGNGTINSPMSFSNAKNTALAGDLYWMKGGTYSGAHTLSRAGTSSKPIVFRAMPNEAVVIDGNINVTGAHNWVWGLEVKDPDGSANGPGIRLSAPGVHVINNRIHDIKGDIGISSWNLGSGQVIYGNIVYKQIPNGMDPHNIYTQNTYSQNGYKYIVGNMFLDSWDANGDSYNFHAYTENYEVTGFHIEKNIFRRGRFLIGGYGEPAQYEIVRNNYFWEAPVLFGWRRPTQIKYENNYMGKSYLETNFYWGAGEQRYPQPLPNVYTGNEIYNPGDKHIKFRTSAYINGNRCDGCPAIRSSDVFNNNKYSSNFSATFYANNQNAGTVNFDTWKSKAASAGNAFDTGSQLVSSLSNKVFVIKNEYEAGRGHIAIYNWTGASSISADLSSVISSGSPYVVQDARTLSVLAQGTYNGPVNIPIGGSQFKALLVTSTGGGGGGGGGGGENDRTSPTLSNIGPRDVTTNSARIIWETGEPADTQLEYGTSPCPCATNSPLDTNKVTSHSVSISGLQSNKTYYYRVKSRDAAGNLAVSSTRTFKTASTSAPALASGEEDSNARESGEYEPKYQSNLHKFAVKKVKSDRVTIKWKTSLPADSQVFYGTSSSYGQSSPHDTSFKKKHSIELNGLQASTTYHFKVRSLDNKGNILESIDYIFTTSGQ